MALDSQWVMIGLLGVNTLSQVLRSGDRWVHNQEHESADHGKDIKDHEERLNKLENRFEKANERWSEKMSELNVNLGKMQMDIAEWKGFFRRGPTAGV